MKPIRGAAESGGATGRLVYSKALIVVAAEQDGKGIGRIRMAPIPDFDRATLHGFIRSSVEPRKHSLHRWAQFLPRNERLYPPPAHPRTASRMGNTYCPESTERGRNPSGSYRLPTPRRLPQRIRLPFQPAKVRFARQALLPVGTARAPDRPDDLRKDGAATRCWGAGPSK